MNTCGEHGDDIAFAGRDCPACEQIESLQKDHEEEINNIEDDHTTEVNDLQSEIDTLESDLYDANQELEELRENGN